MPRMEWRAWRFRWGVVLSQFINGDNFNTKLVTLRFCYTGDTKWLMDVRYTSNPLPLPPKKGKHMPQNDGFHVRWPCFAIGVALKNAFPSVNNFTMSFLTTVKIPWKMELNGGERDRENGKKEEFQGISEDFEQWNGILFFIVFFFFFFSPLFFFSHERLWFYPHNLRGLSGFRSTSLGFE